MVWPLCAHSVPAKRTLLSESTWRMRRWIRTAILLQQILWWRCRTYSSFSLYVRDESHALYAANYYMSLSLLTILDHATSDGELFWFVFIHIYISTRIDVHIFYWEKKRERERGGGGGGGAEFLGVHASSQQMTLDDAMTDNACASAYTLYALYAIVTGVMVVVVLLVLLGFTMYIVQKWKRAAFSLPSDDVEELSDPLLIWYWCAEW